MIKLVPNEVRSFGLEMCFTLTNQALVVLLMIVDVIWKLRLSDFI